MLFFNMICLQLKVPFPMLCLSCKSDDRQIFVEKNFRMLARTSEHSEMYFMILHSHQDVFVGSLTNKKHYGKPLWCNGQNNFNFSFCTVQGPFEAGCVVVQNIAIAVLIFGTSNGYCHY